MLHGRHVFNRILPVALCLAVQVGTIDVSVAGRCAYVDVDSFGATEPKPQCFNPEMTCRPDERYGCFQGQLQLKSGWIDGGQAGQLRELSAPFGYIDPDGLHWDVPSGFRTDGASIPLFFRPVIGGPWSDTYVKAAVIHDFYIRRASVSAAAVHKVFYFALRAAGNSQRRAEEMYFAVANFGPQWKQVDMAAYEQMWRARKAMLNEVTRWHQTLWNAFEESERMRKQQEAIDREVLSRPLQQRTKLFTLPGVGDALSSLDVFVDGAIHDHILHPDRDAALIHALSDQVKAELSRPEGERDNRFVVQLTALGATTTKFAARSDAEVQAQLDLIDQFTRSQEQAKDIPFDVCVGECLDARARNNKATPAPPRLGP